MNEEWLPLALSPPLLTADLPGLGGCIKVVPEDFEVEEIPAYRPCGQGDFLYLWVEKRGLGAEYFVRQLARRLEVPVSEVGTAGLKDRQAVTRQMVSVPGRAEARLSCLDGEGIQLLGVGRHGNKLKPGHLHGNRFRILVRDLNPAVDVQQVLPLLLERLKREGFPNYYGRQRFGRDADTLRLGLSLLPKGGPGAKETGPGKKVRNPFLRKLALSAVQSCLFNHYLGRRLSDGLLRRVLEGDVMAKLPFGGLFVAQDTSREQQRFDAGEIVTTGPIFGRKMFPAAQEAAQREAAILQAFQLGRSSFEGFGKLVQGSRRHNLAPVMDLSADMRPEGLQISFTLPAGSYATVLLREMLKTDLSTADESEPPPEAAS